MTKTFSVSKKVGLVALILMASAFGLFAQTPSMDGVDSLKIDGVGQVLILQNDDNAIEASDVELVKEGTLLTINGTEADTVAIKLADLQTLHIYGNSAVTLEGFSMDHKVSLYMADSSKLTLATPLEVDGLRGSVNSSAVLTGSIISNDVVLRVSGTADLSGKMGYFESHVSGNGELLSDALEVQEGRVIVRDYGKMNGSFPGAPLMTVKMSGDSSAAIKTTGLISLDIEDDATFGYDGRLLTTGVEEDTTIYKL